MALRITGVGPRLTAVDVYATGGTTNTRGVLITGSIGPTLRAMDIRAVAEPGSTATGVEATGTSSPYLGPNFIWAMGGASSYGVQFSGGTMMIDHSFIRGGTDAINRTSGTVIVGATRLEGALLGR